MVTLFLVEWDGRGFYAKAQPTYEWSFTTDRTKAATYRSEKAALERACGDRFGVGHGNKPWRIVKVDGNFELLGQPDGFRIDNPFRTKRFAQAKGEQITLAMLKGKS